MRIDGQMLGLIRKWNYQQLEVSCPNPALDTNRYITRHYHQTHSLSYHLSGDLIRLYTEPAAGNEMQIESLDLCQALSGAGLT